MGFSLLCKWLEEPAIGLVPLDYTTVHCLQGWNRQPILKDSVVAGGTSDVVGVAASQTLFAVGREEYG